jgi:hypothetical protein
LIYVLSVYLFCFLNTSFFRLTFCVQDVFETYRRSPELRNAFLSEGEPTRLVSRMCPGFHFYDSTPGTEGVSPKLEHCVIWSLASLGSEVAMDGNPFPILAPFYYPIFQPKQIHYHLVLPLQQRVQTLMKKGFLSI